MFISKSKAFKIARVRLYNTNVLQDRFEDDTGNRKSSQDIRNRI